MATVLPTPPRVGMVSLGCPKALVDSERILTKLRADGYDMSPDYAGADVVLVNTCGFLDSAKEESLEAIGEAIAENGRVIVTGCMGKEADVIRARFPGVLAVTGPQQYEEVVGAVHEAAPPIPAPFVDLVPEAGLKLTPRHYSYLKISEGCNHRCAFCIIPSHARRSRQPPPRRDPARSREARRRRDEGTAGHQPGHQRLRRRHPPRRWPWKGREVRAHMTDLARELGKLTPRRPLGPPPLRLPLPPRRPGHSADGRGAGPPLPRHPVPARQPQGAAGDEAPGQRGQGARAHPQAGARMVPDIAIRSSFVVGFPGETEEDFQYLLDWLEEAQLDRVGAFRFEPVEGAAANALPDPVPEEVKEERYARIMELTARISAEKLAAKVGATIDVLIDAVDADTGGATGRSKADAPEIDGEVHLRDAGGLRPGDIVRARVEEADEHDLFGVPV